MSVSISGVRSFGTMAKDFVRRMFTGNFSARERLGAVGVMGTLDWLVGSKSSGEGALGKIGWVYDKAMMVGSLVALVGSIFFGARMRLLTMLMSAGFGVKGSVNIFEAFGNLIQGQFVGALASLGSAAVNFLGAFGGGIFRPSTWKELFGFMKGRSLAFARGTKEFIKENGIRRLGDRKALKTINGYLGDLRDARRLVERSANSGGLTDLNRQTLRRIGEARDRAREARQLLRDGHGRRARELFDHRRTLGGFTMVPREATVAFASKMYGRKYGETLDRALGWSAGFRQSPHTHIREGFTGLVDRFWRGWEWFLSRRRIATA